MDLIEGEYPILKCELQEFVIAMGQTAEGSGGWIDQGTQCAGEKRFSAGRWAANDQNRVRPDGAEGGDEPGEHADAVAWGE